MKNIKENYYTVKEVADMLGLSVQAVYYKVKIEQIKSIRFLNKVLIEKKSFDMQLEGLQ